MKPKIETSKEAAKKAGINLSEDVQNWQDGLTKHRNIKRTDKICPRCRSRRVNRVLRRCDDCKGILLWSGDSTSYWDERYEHYYMWYKSIFGLEGWYDADYFKNNWEKVKY